MKSKWISLMICLMMTSSLLSQTLSTDSLIAVPRDAVKNALVVKSQFDVCQEELKTTQELVSLQSDKIELQSQQLANFSVALQSKDQIIQQKDNLIELKDGQIKTLKKQKRGQFWNGLFLGGAGGAALIAILFVL